MIDYIRGLLVERRADGAVLEVGGIGLMLFLSSSTLATLPETGKQVTLRSYLHVKEDLLQLYGFSSREEKDLFLKLITVSGVGPRLALTVLSAYSPEAFARIVASEDLESVTAISGIGKKSGQRIILELKEKLGPVSPDMAGILVAAGGQEALNQAREALRNLGYTSSEAGRALEGYASDGQPAVEELVRYALQNLRGGE